MYLIYDTETTGFPKNFAAPHTDTDNWPRMVQIAWQLHGEDGSLIEAQNHIIFPDGFTIPFSAQKVHGISTDRAKKEGKPLQAVLEIFNQAVNQASFIIGHNVSFDQNVTACEFYRLELPTALLDKKEICTKETTPNFTQLPGGKGGQFKWPTLSELHFKLFGEYFDEAHNAAADVEATARVFFGILKERVIGPPEFDIPSATYEAIDAKADEIFSIKVDIGTTMKQAQADIKKKLKEEQLIRQAKDIVKEVTTPFVHLHVHSQFSVLQSTISIEALIAKAVEHKMPAVALTDLGNLYGAFKFVAEAERHGIKPIVGAELYMVEDRTQQKFTKDMRDIRYQQVFLAKNKTGYTNLSKLCSYGFTEGLYAGYPRIDKALIASHKGDLIALTGGIYGEVPNLILNVGETQAEEAFLWWLDHFQDDFYVELVRHQTEEEAFINEVLLRLAKKYNVKVLATNEVFYADKADHNAHDILLCVKDNEQQSTPIGKGRGFRYGLPSKEYYFKGQDEMKALFADLPEAISNIQEVLDKTEAFKLSREVLLPKFEIPTEFVDPEDEKDGGKRGENAYLRHLTYEGAKKRYAEITPEIKERLDFELETIANTGYPGYFLIVQDFTTKAREMGVSVGPGRGSAAGSAVAYCVGITNVDPIAYDLLFERFLNPERVSLPDIDIDFDDEGRQKVIDYVIEKYGSNQVAQIITYGTMAAKSSIRDTARVLGLLPFEADKIAKSMPDGISLNKVLKLAPEDLKVKLSKSEDLEKAKAIRGMADANDRDATTIKQAMAIEGSLRNTGIHACGVIITPDDITNFVPVGVAKDSNMWCTQFDNSVVESAGLLKMDFLGLSTLTLIKEACRLIKLKHNIDIDIDAIPLDDTKTYELFQRGETVGIFQYESPGMQKHMRDLKPTTFTDLIAMNALYRPGPIQYIPDFIDRRHGRKPVTYDLPAMQEYLEETYGITVYQEQVMLLSQKLAGFSKGEADTLRKAMGKKKIDLIEKMKPQFLDQGEARGHDRSILEKVWTDWEAFASYAFNKSHSTCYAWIAYQTAYLKANYPSEYMAATLSNSMGDIKDITKFMEEAKRMGVRVLNPDINESEIKFTVNQHGQIRFGLGAVKGVGASAVESILEEREKNGPFKNLFDIAARVNLRSVNKKTFESLAQSGAFDSFGANRSVYFFDEGDGQNFIEKAIRYGNKYQQNEASMQQSLFGESSEVDLPAPVLPDVPPWPAMERLKREKELVGVFISGHPLDQYHFEVSRFCNAKFADLDHSPEQLVNKELRLAGVVTSFSHDNLQDRKAPSGRIVLADYTSEYTIWLRGETYAKFSKYFQQDWFLMVVGKLEQAYNQPGRFYFKLMDMMLLSEVSEKMTNKLSLKLPLDQLDAELLERLSKLLNNSKGRCKLEINVYDQQKETFNRVKLKNRTGGVQVNNDFLTQLSSLPHIEFQLN